MRRRSTSPSKKWASWALCLLASLAASQARELDLLYVGLDLPGAPAQLIPVEIDGDPGPELAVVVAYTAWDEIALEETSEIDEVEGLVAVMTIVPALLENRELWLFDRQADGAWQALGDPFELATDIVSLEPTSQLAVPLLAITDTGADAIRPLADGSGLERIELVAAATALAGTGAFLPHLRWVYDLDGDPWPDLLLPTRQGWALHPGLEGGFAPDAVQRLALPPLEHLETPWRRDVPLPEVRDVDGDDLPDILTPHPSRGWNAFFAYRNLGRRFSAPLGPLGTAGDRESGLQVVFFDDLDGDGSAEYVVQEEISAEDAGMKEMAHAKRPPQRYSVFDAGPNFGLVAEPRRVFVADGHAFPGTSDIRLPGGLWDLDGDGRRDLVTLTLDFSVLQAVRVLVARSLNIGLDFHVLCQQPDGAFSPSPGLDLSGSFRLNLNNFRQGQLSLFSGDFDGDGRKDFLQIGRGRTVSIHRGGAGCRFPSRPDLEIELVEAPKDLALVEVGDLDGDGLADLAVTQPRSRRRDAQSSPVRLDLYLSGGRR